MPVLLGLILPLALAYCAYLLVRGFAGRKPNAYRVLREALAIADSPPDTGEQVREGELSRQLVLGRLDPADYRRAMTDLAHARSSRARGAP